MKFTKTININGIETNVDILIGKILTIKVKFNKKKERYSKLKISVYGFEESPKDAIEYVIKKPKKEIVELLLMCIGTNIDLNQEKHSIICASSTPCFLMLDQENEIIAVASIMSSASWIFVYEDAPKYIPVSNDIYEKYQALVFTRSYSKFYSDKQILISNWFANLINNNHELPYSNIIENTIVDKFYDPFIDSKNKVWSKAFSFSNDDIKTQAELCEILEILEFLGFEVRELKNNKFRVSHPNLQWLK